MLRFIFSISHTLKTFISVGSKTYLPRRTLTTTGCRLSTSQPQPQASHPAHNNTRAYHPVSVGETYNGRYKVIRQLGKGQYSTVWLVRDSQNDRVAALKILVAGMSTPKYKAVWDERGVLQTLQTTNPKAEGYNHICQLLDSFTHSGPNGEHICLVMQNMDFSVGDVFRGQNGRVALPLPVIKRVCRHMLRALQYLHECGVVHTDIKDDNILVGGTPRSDPTERVAKVDLAYLMSATYKLSDFGAANAMNNRVAEIIQPEKLRAPEVIIEAKWDTKADIWNLGCLIYEFARGAVLFDPHWNNAESGMNPAQTHLAQISGLCGDFPLDMLAEGKDSKKYFDDKGILRQGAGRYHITLDDLLMRAGHPAEDVREMSEFLLKMLVVDPKERWSAAQLLSHPWVQNKNAVGVKSLNTSWARQALKRLFTWY